LTGFVAQGHVPVSGSFCALSFSDTCLLCF